jgi:hypothetical protein
MRTTVIRPLPRAFPEDETMKTLSPRPRHLLALLPLAALALAGCDTSPAAPADDALLSAHDHQAAHGAHANRGNPVRAHGDLLKAVRSGTSNFNSLRQAEMAGYEVDPHCVEVPGLGAMGHHAVNMDLIDPVFDPMQPEALLYIPHPNGRLELVGVEYIVINVGQDWPEFDGHPFDFEGVPPLMEAGVPHWSLHVWTHADNPNGTFTPFNPALSCG